MSKQRILTTLAVMAILLAVAALPALAETKNGPMVVLNDYPGTGQGSFVKLDPETGSAQHLYRDASGRDASGNNPHLSPDGKTVFFDLQGQIYSIPIDGSAAPTQLTTADPNHPDYSKSMPMVSPDGKTLYFQYTDNSGNSEVNDIYSVPIEGGDITRVTHDNIRHDNLQITPDGRYFLYQRVDQDIYLQPVSGGDDTLLYDCRTLVCNGLAVSPDGATVAFTTNTFADGFAIYTIPFSTTGSVTPTKVLGPGPTADQQTSLTFSPDGKYIAYNVVQYDFSDCGGYFCEPDFISFAQTRWTPVEGDGYYYVDWPDFFAPSQVVWAPAIVADTTGPTSTAASSPQANGAGWNNSDVTVTLSATDDDGGSGVEKITYSASGAQSIEQKDESGSSVEVKLDQEGTTTLTYFATDKAGNVEAPKTLTVKIDKTRPSISSTDPMNNATGVLATANITATFLEEGSGIDPNTLTDSTFKVVQVKPTGNVSVSGKVSYKEDSKKAIFDPSTSLVKGLYKATITTGVKDKAGNALANNYTWLFTTAGPSKK